MDDEREIAGRPIGEAVDIVVDRGLVDDPGTARTVLTEVTDDGVVGWDATRDAFAHLSKVVSTPETRLELAADELESAHEAAADVADRPVVRSRVETFEAQYETVEARVADLGTELRRLLDRRSEAGALYEVAAGIRSLTSDANDCQRAADELLVELEEFQDWLADPAVRYESLDQDLDALADSIEDLDEAAEAITTAAGEEPPDQWVDATVQARVLDLMVADLRWEFEELRRWDGNEHHAVETVGAALETQEARLGTIQEHLENVAQPAWTARYEDHLAAVDASLDEFEPPVDWGAVERSLESITPSE